MIFGRKIGLDAVKPLAPLKPLDGLKPVKADLEKLTSFPEGPRRFAALKKPPTYVGGPGDAPLAFNTASTSLSEWPPYWACCVLFHNPTMAQHRNPPYEGPHGLLWAYQKNVTNILGHAFSSDFIIHPNDLCREGVVIRIQTEHFHIFSPTHIQAFDRRQRQGVEANYRVIDIYDYLFLWDKSGAAIIKWMKLAMAGIEPINLPMTTRSARKSRQK